MKKLLILLFSLLISSISFASWTLIGSDVNQNQYYIDFVKVKKVDRYHYFWWMTDLLEPDNEGDLSYLVYFKTDCKLLRSMTLIEYYYTQSMGTGNLTTNNVQNPEWLFHPPESMNENMIEEVCEYVK